MFGTKEAEDVDDGYRKSDLTGFLGNQYEFPAKPVVPSERVSEETPYIDKKVYKEIGQDKILHPAPSSEDDGEIEDPDEDDALSVNTKIPKMTTVQFAEQHHKRKLPLQKNGIAVLRA